ncbi:MAG: hypothetical protein QXD09_04170, partial [Candidatus Caldarchaeum sp.]
GRVWLETGPWRGHWVGGRAVGRQTTYEGCLDNAGRRSPHPFHLCFSDTMGVFERVCGWMLETRRHKITFKGFRRHPLSAVWWPGLGEWFPTASQAALPNLYMGRGMSRSSQAKPPGLQVAEACSPAHKTTGERRLVWKAASPRQGSGLLKKGGRS